MIRFLLIVDVLDCQAIIPTPRIHRCGKPTHPGAVTCVEHLDRHEALLHRTVETINRAPITFNTLFGDARLWRPR